MIVVPFAEAFFPTDTVVQSARPVKEVITTNNTTIIKVRNIEFNLILLFNSFSSFILYFLNNKNTFLASFLYILSIILDTKNIGVKQILI